MHFLIGFITYGLNEKEGFNNAIEVAEKYVKERREAEKKAKNYYDLETMIFDCCVFFDEKNTIVDLRYSRTEKKLRDLFTSIGFKVIGGGWAQSRYGDLPVIMRADSKEGKEFIDFVIQRKIGEKDDWYRTFINANGSLIFNKTELQKAMKPPRQYLKTFVIPADIHC